MVRRMRWFARVELVLGVVVLAAACEGGRDADDRGNQADAGRGGDGSGGGDWPPDRGWPDAAAPDGAHIPSDQELCTELCAITYECAGAAAPDPRCASSCEWALFGCDDRVAALADCADLPCDQVAACIVAEGCIDPDWVCGDGQCSDDENCESCPGDCECACGDGACSPGEDCETCGPDCGPCACGDRLCSPGECASCTADCPAGCFCPHDECSVGDPLDPGCGDCIASVCNARSSCCTTSWDPLCVARAEAACGLTCPAVCGDLRCDEGENNETCPQDCRPRCGDGVCTPGVESCDFCSEDCGPCACGDGACTIGECGTCEADCPGCVCPHDVCTVGEPLDRRCGLCEWRVCSSWSDCCSEEWDELCRLIAENVCEVDC